MTNLDISAAYVGSTGVDKLCLGNEVVWPTTPPAPVPYEQQYFTIEALSGGSFNIRHADVGYSVNGGAWETTAGPTNLTLEQGDKVRFKSVAASGQTRMFQYNAGRVFKVYGNIESMEYGDDFTGATAVKNASAFMQYFSNCRGLADAENLVLPATALTNNCYHSMFENCSGLTQAPALPATTLANYCYYRMFYGCSGLTQAPALPATTLAKNCYHSMFNGCSGLTQAPALPATTLEYSCYREMFNGCTNLSSITCLATTLASSSDVIYWVTGVSPTGTFYKHPDMNDWPTGDNGIPAGWTVLDYTPS